MDNGILTGYDLFFSILKCIVTPLFAIFSVIYVIFDVGNLIIFYLDPQKC